MISGVTSIATPPAMPVSPGRGGEATPGTSFSDLLARGIQDVSASEQQAQTMVARSLAGDEVSSAEVFTAVKKADLSLKMMLQIRNSLMNAFDEIQKMQF